MAYDRNEAIARISKAITDVLGPDVELDECAEIVIQAAIDAGIPVNDLRYATDIA